MSDMSKVSDGFHTFGELYEHRTALFAALCRLHPMVSWRSRQHEVGGPPMFEGMFVAGMTLISDDLVFVPPPTQITYHCENNTWDWFDDVRELPHAPEYDGHSSIDVLDRLNEWLPRVR